MNCFKKYSWCLVALLLMLGALLLPGTVKTAEATTVARGACGSLLTWTLDNGGTLTISGTGGMWDVIPNSWESWNSYINTVQIDNGVTSTVSSAFSGCRNLTSITMPGNISVGYRAFVGCDNLTSATFTGTVVSKSTVRALPYTQLASVTIGDSVTSIGSEAFRDCTNLTSVTIGDSVGVIGSNAFDGTSWYNSDTNWENGGLYLDKWLVKVEPAFVGTYSVKEKTAHIADGAFSGCVYLQRVTIPDSVTSIGSAFVGCSSLTEIAVAANNSTYSSVEGVLFNKSQTALLRYPAGRSGAYTIPDNVMNIGAGAFSGCSGLTSITIPGSVTNIGSNAFSGCSVLTAAAFISGSVTNVKVRALPYTQLRSVTIGSGVTSIEDYAFINCSSLRSVKFICNAPTIGKYPFKNVKATAYYGQSNTTWSADKRKSCGGELTWEAIDSVGACGTNLVWELDSNGTLTVFGKGAMSDYSLDTPWYSIRSSVKSVVITSEVTSIGSFAFFNCDKLTNVVIESSKIGIGNCAFERCSSLTSITIPGSLTSIGDRVFTGCNSLTNATFTGTTITNDLVHALPYDQLCCATILSSVTSIGSNAFEGCSGLPSVTIPDSVTSIGSGAFRDCSNLTSITMPGNVSVGDGSFAGCDNLTSATFTGTVVSQSTVRALPYTQLASVTIGDSVQTIGIYAFEGCSGLPSATIPDSVTGIGAGAFRDCISLASVTFESSEFSYVLSIGNNAFSGCSNLTSITLPSRVKAIGDFAFSNCISLENIILPGSIYSIGSSTFVGTLLYNNPDNWEDDVLYIGNYLIEAKNTLTEYIVKSNTYLIARGAFYDCTRLKSIKIPDSVEYIGDYVFYNCSSLTSAEIDSVKYIGNKAFYNCSSLTSVEISGARSIGDEAFYNCSGLGRITIPGSVSVGTDAFTGCDMLRTATFTGAYVYQNVVQALTKLTSVTLAGSVREVYATFSGRRGAAKVYFLGNAPTFISEDAFNNVTAVVFYRPSTTGWNGTVKKQYGGTLTWKPSVVEYITVATLPTKTDYLLNEKINMDGLVLRATYTDGITETVTSGYTTVYAFSALGEQDVYVTYGDKLATFTVTVKASVLTDIVVATQPDKTEYRHNEALETDGLTLTALYSDGSTETITDGYTVSGFDSDTPGQKTVTVTYEGKTTTFTVTVLPPALTFYAASLTLQNNLKVNLLVDKTFFTEVGYTNPSVVFTLDGRETVVSNYTVGGKNGNYYVFSLADIAPSQMNDTITAVLHATYDEAAYESEPLTYSITQYCYSMLGKDNTANNLRTLLVNLLRYGAAAQRYTGHHTDTLADAALTAEQAAWGTAGDPALTSVSNGQYAVVDDPAIHWKGAGLRLGNAIRMQFYFTAESVADITVQIKKGDGEVLLSATETDFTRSGDYYVLTYSGLGAGQMSEAVYVTAYRNETAVSNTVRYSVESYACAKRNDSDANLATLVKAMMHYGNAAYAYTH